MRDERCEYRSECFFTGLLDLRLEEYDYDVDVNSLTCVDPIGLLLLLVDYCYPVVVAAAAPAADGCVSEN